MQNSGGEKPSPEYLTQWKDFTESQLEHYRNTLDSAQVEMDMQRHMEENANFITQLISPLKDFWVIPRKRLGSEYETDFLIANEGDFEYSWHAVELERPQAQPFNRNGDASAALNHAIGQIDDWRSWLSRNRSYAESPRSKSGLGLIDIDPELPGIVILGRGVISNPVAISRKKGSKETSASLYIRTTCLLVEPRKL